MGACMSSPAVQPQHLASLQSQACAAPCNKTQQLEGRIGRVYSAAPLSNSVVISQVRGRTLRSCDAAGDHRRLCCRSNHVCNHRI